MFWFNKLAHIIPNHFVTADISKMPEEVQQYRDQLEGRAMLVRKAKVLPLEAIVRGYITGESFLDVMHMLSHMRRRIGMEGI